MEKNYHRNDMSRREFLRRIGLGAGSAIALMALEPLGALAQDRKEAAQNRMTYRVQHGTGEHISLLGFGMMRLPNDQEEVNKLVDYAVEHGVNYFDTAPIYMNGESEVLTGNALARYPREKYFVATKMSNMWGDTSLENAKEMYHTSMRKLRVDYIDYYLLHGIGNGGMESLNKRFIDNGLPGYLLEERKAGRIRHLGFSYHGDVRVPGWLPAHQEQYHWDFCQIQMNFPAWRHASQKRGRRGGDADAEYLYNKCEKTGVQCVDMEPLRGGAFGKMAQELTDQLKAVHPDDSPARQAFRWVGSFPNILTTLSGMNRMEHLEENVKTFSRASPLHRTGKPIAGQHCRPDVGDSPPFPAPPAPTVCPVPTGWTFPAISPATTRR